MMAMCTRNMGAPAPLDVQRHNVRYQTRHMYRACTQLRPWTNQSELKTYDTVIPWLEELQQVRIAAHRFPWYCRAFEALHEHWWT